MSAIRLILLIVALVSAHEKLKEIDAVVPEELVSHLIALDCSTHPHVCVCVQSENMAQRPPLGTFPPGYWHPTPAPAPWPTPGRALHYDAGTMPPFIGSPYCNKPICHEHPDWTCCGGIFRRG